MGFTLNQLEQERQIRKLQKKEDKDTKDYEQLSNLPKINNVELKGNKTSSALGLSSAADIATVFNENTNYTAGLFVYYEGTLYQFNADHAAGAWDPTDVVAANVTDQVVSNAAAIAGLTANVKMFKAWENQDPSVDFAAQSVTLSAGDYDLLVVIANYATTFGDNVSNISSGSSGYLTFSLAGSNGPAIYSRLYSVSGNQVTFGDCEMSAHNAPTKVIANNTLIPYQIYKIKLA